MMNTLLLFVPTIIFMVVVAPIWLLLHYFSKSRSSGALDENDKRELESLLVMVDRLTDRIDVLEHILDTDTPDWRTRKERTHQTHSRLKEGKYNETR